MAPVLWVNGSFGAGKSSVVEGLRQRRPEFRVVDPEMIGFVVKRIPGIGGGDYQDLALWRRLVNWQLRLAARGRRPVVVPMTLVVPRYREELQRGLEVLEVTLLASPGTLHSRLRDRGVTDGEWAHQQVERCVAALADADPNLTVDTEKRSLHEVIMDVILIWDRMRPNATAA